MLGPLFPSVGNPFALLALLTVRFACNAGLALVVAASVGRRSPLTAVFVVGTLVSAALSVAVFQPGGPGLAGSYAELAVQFLLLVVASYVLVARRPPSTFQLLMGGLGVLLALFLTLSMIPLYGDAFVAP